MPTSTSSRPPRSLEQAYRLGSTGSGLADGPSRERLRVTLAGAVQGVGFRPFVYRLATEMGLAGWTRNSSGGLVVEVEGDAVALTEFLERLDDERPAASVVLAREVTWLAPSGLDSFSILDSDDSEARTSAILPDLATCPECLAETLDPEAWRFGYPFTNCTSCGPRYSIVLDIPYDRPNTTMRGFAMCPDCRREYENPRDRRFHAQPIACPRCGPCLNVGLTEATQTLRDGGVLALKGVGGFQLLCDAQSEQAVARLRERKRREAKPLAVMMRSVEEIRRYCRVSPLEEQTLVSTAAPIVLLEPSGPERLAENVSDASPFLGVMLPCSPLHHLLLREFPSPVVATSGNFSGDPIEIDNERAKRTLGPVVDRFVLHDRPIARPVDDSVVRISGKRLTLVRRARGYAPLPIPLSVDLPNVLAVGGHMKNAVAIGFGRQVILSQHIGDLDTPASREAFERAIDDLCRLYEFEPDVIACDLHPDYASTQWARRQGKPLVAVQHHHAHAAACAAENDIQIPYLAICWDGTGYGLDGTIWGGEFFVVDRDGFHRFAHLRPFALPGGEAAVREGRRAALSLLWEAEIQAPAEPLMRQMLERGINSPQTTSVGRLFDAVASLAGVAHQSRFEGQAAMLLERAAGAATGRPYPLPGGDWEPLIQALLADREAGAPQSVLAARFHEGLVEWAVSEARRAGLERVALSGGVFQNARLTDTLVERLSMDGRTVAVHQRTPPNDGGLALDQAVLAGLASSR
ncbi:MAG: carbamoyltransferase HypF [Bryobacterales bacterium]